MVKYLKQLKQKDIPIIKAELLKKQGGVCFLCKSALLIQRDICLDHDHQTGYVRSVLCRSCNSFEGRVYKLFVRLGLRKRGIGYTLLLRELAKYHNYKPKKYKYPVKTKTKKRRGKV